MHYKAALALESVMILLAGVIIWVYTGLVQRSFFSDKAGAIVLIASDEEPKAFGEQVASGAEKARAQLLWNGATQQVPELERMHLGIEAQNLLGDAHLTPAMQWHIRHQIMQRLARGHVLGFISAGSSTVDHEVARVAGALRIPLTITTATNADVIPQMSPTTVVRMVGNNGSQADAIAAWIGTKARIAILYQPSAYGNQLAALISAKVSAHDVYILPFPISSATDYADLSKVAEAYKFSAFVIVGYPPRVGELVAAVSLLQPNAPILISDAGVGVAGRSDRDIYVCLPVNPATAQGLVGFEPLGHDAYQLLANLHTNASDDSFVGRLNSIIGSGRIQLYTTQTFTAYGERPDSRFFVKRIGN